MKAREFINEAPPVLGTVQSTPAPKGTADTDSSSKTANDQSQNNQAQTDQVNKLTASVADLQKQLKNLQKVSLQQLSMQPKPGESSRAQAPVGTIGTGKGDGQVPPAQQQAQQQPQQPAQPATAPQPALTKQTIGQLPAAQPKPGSAPGVNQPPAVTKMNLQRDLIKNVAGGR